MHGNAFCQGTITTVAGNGITQYIGDGYPATNYSLALPDGICADKNGNLIIADKINARIRLLTPGDSITTIIGDSVGFAGDGGPASAALLTTPSGVCMDTAGNLFITDWYHAVVRRVDAHTGIINTVCGNGTSGYSGDGGPATAASLQSIGGAKVDIYGNLYVPDYNNQRIRKVDGRTGTITTIAGTGANGYTGDGGPATDAQLSYPNSLCLDSLGNIFFSEYGNHTVRKIDAVSGVITTIAGTGSYGYSGDGGPAAAAHLSRPNGVFIDATGRLFVSDYGNNVIRCIDNSGIIRTIAGTGAYGYSGDGGDPLLATLNQPAAVFVDPNGIVYIADGENSVIRKIKYPPVAVASVKKGQVNIYPNPGSGTIYINLPQVGDERTINIYNMAGQLILNKKLSASINRIDLGNSPPGLYLLQFEDKATYEIIVLK